MNAAKVSPSIVLLYMIFYVESYDFIHMFCG